MNPLVQRRSPWKDRASLTTLITALFYDLSPEKDLRIPAQSEHRGRALRDPVRKSKRPVVLFVDEAHDLHHKTLSGLKRPLSRHPTPPSIAMAALEARSSMTRETIRSPDAPYPNRVGSIVRTVCGFKSVWMGGMHWNPQQPSTGSNANRP